MTKLERSLRTRRHEPAAKHITLLKSKPRCYTQSINVHVCMHCKNKCVILQKVFGYYKCMTILTMQFYECSDEKNSCGGN